jgi:hypothetical protein
LFCVHGRGKSLAVRVVKFGVGVNLENESA